jgi:hypothetical protein
LSGGLFIHLLIIIMLLDLIVVILLAFPWQYL